MAFETLAATIRRLEIGAPPSPNAGLFGGDPDPAECGLLLIPVPWDATVSYGVGTAAGPSAILAASHQLDLEDSSFVQPYRAGISMLAPAREIEELNKRARPAVERVIAALENDASAQDKDLAIVNYASERVNALVAAAARTQLQKKKLVGVVGGDHSSPFGLIEALAEVHPDGFGILHVDAHLDLRDAYEGFNFSHASIMHNVMTRIKPVQKLVQVAIRDYSRAERLFGESLGTRHAVFFGHDLFRRRAHGENWGRTCAAVVEKLPKKVYISFDIDGLDPSFCPSTGTPVPGGISYDEAVYLIEALAASDRQIVGFDLCEVAPADQDDEWDANVGARLLYKLCGATLFSNGACDATPGLASVKTPRI